MVMGPELNLGAALVAAGAALLLLGVHPFTTYPLSLRLLASRFGKPLKPSQSAPNRVALCVCAYNEQRIIADKIANMLAVRKTTPGLEILVYVDGATDCTPDIVRSFGDQTRAVISPARHGKTQGMNTLAAMTDADILVFSDANVMFAPDAVARLLTAFADPEVGTACGQLVYVGATTHGTAKAGSAYWRLEEAIKALESETGSVMGADGSIFAVRRSLRESPPPDLIDDMYTSLATLCDGARIVRVGEARAYEEVVSHPGEEYRRKIRIACQAFNVHRALRPRLARMSLLDRYKYVSHKLLRWLVIYFLALGAIAVLAGFALMGWGRLAAGLLAAGFLFLLLVLTVRRGPLASLRDVLLAFVATGIGVARSLRGERFQIWTPPASARALALHSPQEFGH